MESTRPPVKHERTGARTVGALIKLLIFGNGSWHVGRDPRDQNAPVFVERTEGEYVPVSWVDAKRLCKRDDGVWIACDGGCTDGEVAVVITMVDLG